MKMSSIFCHEKKAKSFDLQKMKHNNLELKIEKYKETVANYGMKRFKILYEIEKNYDPV